MPSSWGSQSMEWPDFTDSSFSKSGNTRSWSNLTHSDQVIYTQEIHVNPPPTSAQVKTGGSWGPCPSWSSDWRTCPPWSALDLGPCPLWSENGSKHQQEPWESESVLGSQPTNECDDSNPGSKFSPLINS
jgi:hypothetical protein